MSTTRRGFLTAAATSIGAPYIMGANGKSGDRLPIIGEGQHKYEVIHDWGELPADISYGNCHGVVEDAQGQIYIHHTVNKDSKSDDAMVVFDSKGKFVRSFGKEFKGGAHGLHIRKEGSQEFLYMCDTKRGVVVKTNLKGDQVWEIGYPDESPEYQKLTKNKDGKEVKIKYTPTNLAIAPNGDIYVGDGYGSSFVNQYTKDAKFVRTFGGGKGKEPGQLNSPHGIIIDERGKTPMVCVADRSNNRLQYFTVDGKHSHFVGNTNLPCHFSIRKGTMLIPDLAARITLFDEKNQLIAHLGEGPENWRALRVKTRDNFTPGKFVSPHGGIIDHKGDIYIVEWVEVGRVTKLRHVS